MFKERHVATKRSRTGCPTITQAIIDHQVTDSCKAVDFYQDREVKGRGDILFADQRVKLLNGIEIGAGPYQRVGNMVQVKEISWDCYVYPNPGGINVLTDAFKLAIVYDRQPTGSLPTYDDIFQQQFSDGSTDNQPLSPQNVNNIDRFFVFRDMKWTLSPMLDQELELGPFPTTVNTYGTAKRGNMMSDKVLTPGLTTVFSGSGYGIGDITTGAFYSVTNGFFNIDPECAWRYFLNVRTFYVDA